MTIMDKALVFSRTTIISGEYGVSPGLDFPDLTVEHWVLLSKGCQMEKGPR